MRTSRFAFLLLLLAALTITAMAAPAPRALGVVLQAEKARVGSSEATSGTTVFSGDKLSTMADGAMRLSFSTAQLYLMPNATVALADAKDWHVAELRKGGVGFSTTGDEHVVVRSGDVQVYPATSQPTQAEVSFVGEDELLVTSVHGPLEVMIGKEIYPVAEATSYRVSLQDQKDPVEGAGKGKASSDRRIRLAAGLIIAGGIITLILLKNAVSPSIP